MSLSALAFAFPWALAALAVLPVIWWLLRLTPPAPLKKFFPPLRLLLGITSQEESSAKTPPWLLLLRLVLAAAVVLAASGPFLDQSAGDGDGVPVLAVVDDGWASAPGWEKRRQYLAVLAARAARQNQPFALLTTAPTTSQTDAGQEASTSVQLVSGNQAPALVAPLSPKAWSVDREQAATALEAWQASRTEQGALTVHWLSDTLDAPGTDALITAMTALGPLTVVAEPAASAAKALRPPTVENGVMTVTAVRADVRAEENVWLRAFSSDGRIAVREQLTFQAQESEASMTLDLPVELANTLTRLDLEEAGGAGATVLLDERWRRRPVGLVISEGGAELPLLSSIYYLDRALRPFSDVREGSIQDLLKRRLSVMVLADPGILGEGERRALDNWVDRGGVAVWFAGPLMAEQSGGENAPPLPVDLRQGDRVLGGAMSWSEPQRLKAFEADSPFHGLDTSDEVTIRRQVLARPGPDIAAKTWARLTDDTPLVTADRQGDGWRILFHTTANTQWSDLALSGVYVEMLRRIVGLSQGVVANASGPPLEPLQTLDAFGRLGPAPLDAEAIAADGFAEIIPSQAHPPGLYGRGDERRAVNLAASIEALAPLGDLPESLTVRGYESAPSIDLRPAFLVLAMILALADMIASLMLRGLFRVPSTVAGLTVAGGMVVAGTAGAQSIDETFALSHSNETRLVYLETGQAEIDRVSRMGLTGLSLIVKRRTAAELATPIGVDPDRDELSFFPLLYWPVVEGAADLTDKARSNINRFMRNGGTILFDTQTQGGSAASVDLRELAETLDIPPLIQVPTDHVLTRAFYLIQEFPGRWAGGGLWIERAGARVNDGVSPVIAGSHNWAAAWALDDTTQRPVFPVVPGGERQREIAYRFGINLVMYTLTGNYKGDQVHLPAIIRRLGQ